MASPRSAIKFGLLEYVRAILLRRQGKHAVLSPAQSFWLGALTTALAGSLLYPVNTARLVITSRRKKAEATSRVAKVESDAHPSEALLQSPAPESNNPACVMLQI